MSKAYAASLMMEDLKSEKIREHDVSEVEEEIRKLKCCRFIDDEAKKPKK